MALQDRQAGRAAGEKVVQGGSTMNLSVSMRMSHSRALISDKSYLSERDRSRLGPATKPILSTAAETFPAPPQTSMKS